MLAQDDMNWFIGTIVPLNHRHLLGGVVLRAANQIFLIASGNHTIIYVTPPYI